MGKLKNSPPNLLTLSDYHDPILHQKVEKITFPLSVEDKQLIKDMKFSIQKEQLKKANAPWEGAAGMAANQWGFNKAIFLFCPEGDPVNGLEVVINPSYEPLDAEEEEAWEGCFSVPMATGNVRRFTHIRIHYQNEAGEIIETSCPF